MCPQNKAKHPNVKSLTVSKIIVQIMKVKT